MLRCVWCSLPQSCLALAAVVCILSARLRLCLSIVHDDSSCLCCLCWQASLRSIPLYLRLTTSCGVSFRAGLLSRQCPDGVAQVQQALVALVGRPKDEYEGQGAGPRGQGEEDGEDGMGPQMEHVMVHYYASRALRR